jgi:mRNA interferase MazF
MIGWIQSAIPAIGREARRRDARRRAGRHGEAASRCHRLGVIVQADELGNTTTSILVCPMSSEVIELHRLCPIVEPSASDGLRLRSQIMTDKINALRRDRIRQVLGTLDADTSAKLDSALLVVLGLAR